MEKVGEFCDHTLFSDFSHGINKLSDYSTFLTKHIVFFFVYVVIQFLLYFVFNSLCYHILQHKNTGKVNNESIKLNHKIYTLLPMFINNLNL